MVLAELAALPPGHVVATGTGPASVVARLSWLRPRRPPSRAEQVAAALDRVGPPGRHRPRRARVVRPRAGSPGTTRRPLLAALLPAEVDQVLIQADLTAVAPGPLTRERARDLHLVADVESRGQATVYRFTAVVRTARVRRRVGGPRGPRLPGLGLTDAGAAAADLPRRRRRPHVRHGPGRARRGLPPRRRRGGPDRAAAPPDAPARSGSAASRRPCWSARRRSTC